MGMTKQKLARLKMIDSLLSNRYHHYSTEDIAEEVSCKMADLDPSSDGVIQRTIQKDIKYLREEWPEFVDIEEYIVPFYSKTKQKTVIKHCLRYTKPGFSIFSKALSDDEEYLLGEALSFLGQFDGLPNLEGLEGLRLGLGVHRTDRKIISLTKNPLENSSILGKLFTAISHKQVIELHYHQFRDMDIEKSVIVHPYLLKEYNRRWYLFAAADDTGKMLFFGLERIIKIVPMSDHRYEEYEGDINEMFEDIIGVSFYEDNPVCQIYFWVSDDSKNYVETKPLHESQRKVAGLKNSDLRSKFSSLKDGQIFRIDCKENYELIRELTSFGKDLIVLEPSNIREDVMKRVNDMYNAYK